MDIVRVLGAAMGFAAFWAVIALLGGLFMVLAGVAVAASWWLFLLGWAVVF